MYCGKCGSKNLDGAEYCANCGAKLSASSIPGGQQTGGAPNSGPSASVSIAVPKKGVNIRNIAIIICVAVVAIVLGTMFLGGRSVQTTVDKIITATFAGDAQGIVDLVPDKVLDQVLRSEGYDRSQLDSFLAEGSDELQVQLNLLALNVGSPMETEHTFTEEDKTQEEIDDLNSEYEEFGVKVSAAKTAWVEVTVSGPVRESTSQMNLPLIKVGKSWYVDVVSLGSLF